MTQLRTWLRWGLCGLGVLGLCGRGYAQLPAVSSGEATAYDSLNRTGERILRLGSGGVGSGGVGLEEVVVLSLEEYLAGLEAYHPVLQQAELLPDQARMALREARGGFDPTLLAAFERKVFKDTRYYDNTFAELKIPTWVGVNVKAGFEQGIGSFVNPETVTPSDGLVFAGVEVPIGGSLVADARRNAVQQAKILPQLAVADRRKLANKLVLDALKAYLEWQLAYFTRELQQAGLDLARFRFEATKARAASGDLAAIDTVEAELEVQKRQVSLREAELDYRVAVFVLNGFVWTPDGQAGVVGEGILPGPLLRADMRLPSQATLEDLFLLADSLNPELQKQRLKLEHP